MFSGVMIWPVALSPPYPAPLLLSPQHIDRRHPRPAAKLGVDLCLHEPSRIDDLRCAPSRISRWGCKSSTPAPITVSAPEAAPACGP